MRSSSLVCTLAALLLSDSASAFSTVPSLTRAELTTLAAQSGADALPVDRAAFLKATFATAAVATLCPTIAIAEDAVDDLSMPTEAEQKAAEDAMAERLRIKAELKKKVSKPMGYKESMEAERNKQKSLQKSKDERRIALCEELGRGC